MGKRRALGNAVRFSVFERDGFTCQYCGGQPPAVVLQVDHVVPVSKGGGDGLDNLVASCADCNIGKFVRVLDEPAPTDYQSKTYEVEKRAMQLAAYRQQLESLRYEMQESIDLVAKALFGEEAVTFPDSRDRVSVARFIEMIGLGKVVAAADTSHLRFDSRFSHTQWKYFCSICWRKSRESAAAEEVA